MAVQQGGGRHGHKVAVADELQHAQDVVLLTQRAQPVEDLFGLGRRAQLDVGEKLAQFGSFGLEDVVPASQGGPATLAFFSFPYAVGAQRLAARAGGSKEYISAHGRGDLGVFYRTLGRRTANRYISNACDMWAPRQSKAGR